MKYTISVIITNIIFLEKIWYVSKVRWAITASVIVAYSFSDIIIILGSQQIKLGLQTGRRQVCVHSKILSLRGGNTMTAELLTKYDEHTKHIWTNLRIAKATITKENVKRLPMYGNFNIDMLLINCKMMCIARPNLFCFQLKSEGPFVNLTHQTRDIEASLNYNIHC